MSQLAKFKLPFELENLSLPFYIASFISILTFIIGWWLDNIVISLLPLAALVAFVAIVNFKPLFYLLLLSLPISIEFYLTDSLALNLPTEPLMAGLMLVFIFYCLLNRKKEELSYLKHPIITTLILLLIWTLISMLYSGEKLVSLKYFFAKCWFIISFVFLGAYCIKNVKDYKIAFWCIFGPLVLVTVYTLVRHYLINFSFVHVNSTMRPFFSNHVDSAVMQVAFLPFCIATRFMYKRGSIARLFIDAGIVLLTLGVIYSYTRAALACLVLIPIIFLIIKLNLTKLVTITGLLALVIGIGLMTKENAYLAFAPNYEKTVYHESWQKHLKATINLKDVSSMERVYRWVAAFRMVEDHPIVGFGPGSFYYFYKQYTVSLFKTYVSENPEKSTVHNYYLLTLVEQGIVGFILFMLVVVMFLFTMQRLYFSALPYNEKYIVAAAGISMVLLLANNFLGDLIEVDKTGSLFFLNIALIISMDMRLKAINNEEAPLKEAATQ